MIVPLPGGKQATLWDPAEMPTGRRNAVLEALAGHAEALGGGEAATALTQEAVTRWLAMSVLAVRAFVRSWELTGPGGAVLPLPWGSPEVIGELPANIFDALVEHATPLVKAMRPAGAVGDPKSGGSSTTPAIPG